MLMNSNEKIEFDFDEVRVFENPCSCCNNTGYAKLGVIYVGGKEFGHYNSSWIDGIKHHGVSIAITKGNIDKDGNYKDNITVYMRARLNNEASEFMMMEGNELPFAKDEIFGKLLSRKDALEHAMSNLFFRIGEQILNEDVDINEYLRKSADRNKKL